MTGKFEDTATFIKEETERRIDIYYDFMPGTEHCDVQPFTMKNFRHTIYLSIILVGMFIWGAVSVFPSYFQA